METKKRIVVIGGSGFLGSHIADALSDAGHEVAVFDARPSAYLRPDQRMILGDIMDRASVRQAVQGADAVYHFAGIADLKEAARLPYETIQFNTLGTINILQACVDAGVKRFLFASSVYVYSAAGSFYRISKLAAELIVEEFQKKYGLDYTVVRYGSLYGSRADLRNGIYRFVHQALHDGKIVYYGTEDDRREYIHVKEAARLSVEALRDDYRNQHVILTGTQALTARQLLTMMREILGNGVDFEIRPPESFINYSVTPYSFAPKLGRKLICTEFTDIGEGIMGVIDEVYREKHGAHSLELADAPLLE